MPFRYCGRAMWKRSTPVNLFLKERSPLSRRARAWESRLSLGEELSVSSS